jgi:hypothetical protein
MIGPLRASLCLGDVESGGDGDACEERGVGRCSSSYISISRRVDGVAVGGVAAGFARGSRSKTLPPAGHDPFDFKPAATPNECSQ